MGLLDFFFDCRCKLCNSHISSGAVCADCDNELMSLVFVSRRRVKTSFGEIDASYVFKYENELVKKLLFALKQRADTELFRYAAKFYSLTVPQGFEGIITNVPRRKVNVRRYGYDHVKEPCRFVAGASGGKVKYAKLIRRRGFSKDQKKLDVTQRRENARGKYTATKKDVTCDILVVDDVITTGNSIISCAEEIYKKNPNSKLHLAFLVSR